MKNIWLYFLPALFLPNMGLAQQTEFGLFQLNDFLIWPYIFLVYFSGLRIRSKPRQMNNELMFFLAVFLLWIIYSTLSSFIINGYSIHALVFSILKISKLALYALAALLTIRAISLDDLYHRFNWSLLASLTVMSVSLLLDRFVFYQETNYFTNAAEFYTDNIVSVTMAIIFSYIFALLLTGYGTQQWQLAAKSCLIVSIFGIALSEGRGGWVALLGAVIYVYYRLNAKRVIGFFLVCLLATVAAYSFLPQFEALVDKTINPDPIHMVEYKTDIAGVETGARWRYMKQEGIKVFDAPIFGSGFFHRGGETGLDPVGSHNFFVQMFLEAGIAGGILTLFIFFLMWHQAGRKMVILVGSEIPVKAAILSAFIAGLSGEYFYGGMVVFVLFLSYGGVGRLPVNMRYGLNN